MGYESYFFIYLFSFNIYLKNFVTFIFIFLSYLLNLIFFIIMDLSCHKYDTQNHEAFHFLMQNDLIKLISTFKENLKVQADSQE